MTDPSDHWAQVYAARATHEVSWYQIRPETSLKLIANLGIQPDDAVIDVGGGASNLVDHLLEQGFTDVTVLDISTAALSAVKVRLGKGGEAFTGWRVTSPTGGPRVPTAFGTTVRYSIS